LRCCRAGRPPDGGLGWRFRYGRFQGFGQPEAPPHIVDHHFQGAIKTVGVHLGIHVPPFGIPFRIPGRKSRYVYSSFCQIFLKSHVTAKAFLAFNG
jgi:hypothetical protein